MVGVDYSRVRKHRFCPEIKENCCTDDDAWRSKFLFNNQSKFILERYYQAYLISIKYLLGFSAEAYLLARKFEVSDQQECKNSALDLISMNFNPNTTLLFYKKLRDSLENVSELRKGFYCIICDAYVQKDLTDFWVSTNNYNRDRVYYSKEFCSTLVDKTITGAFYTINYLKRYLENLSVLSNCQSGYSNQINFEIDLETQNHVKNCYFFKEKYFFYFCQDYCEKFRLTRFNKIFDGDIEQLRNFVN